MSTGDLGEDLGYRHSEGNRIQRALRRVAGTRVGADLLSHTLRHTDTVIGRVTHGRHSAPGLFTGISVLQVTTTGRRTGARRTSHLIATPHGASLALIGTNFGQPTTPAWVHNLEADPRAVVTHRGVSREVVARPASSEEADEIIDRSATFYPGYGHYRRRLGNRRRVRVFVLDPLPEALPPDGVPPRP